MHDPFPLPPLPWLSNLITPLSTRFALHTLPLHIHEVVFFALLYAFIQLVVSPRLSARLFPRHYARLSARNRANWDVHVVSFVQSVLVCALAIAVMRADEERSGMNKPPRADSDGLLGKYLSGGFEERVWGYTGALGLVQAAGCGYFVWDLVVSVMHLDMFGVGMLVHATSALTVFLFGFRPFVNYYAPTFILYELSSPFLNIHWFCDKLDMTGSKTQLINGFALLGSFFGCRLFWGSWQSLCVLLDVVRAANVGGISFGMAPANNATALTVPYNADESDVLRFISSSAAPPPVPLWLAAAYLGANISLNGLNWYWFGKMIATIRKRFPPPLGTKGLHKSHRHSRKESQPQLVVAETTGATKTVYADGHKSVEFGGTQVKRVNANAHVNAKPNGDEASLKQMGGFLDVPERRDEGSSEDEPMVP